MLTALHAELSQKAVTDPSSQKDFPPLSTPAHDHCLSSLLSW
jgi:hypothetical protein